MLQTAAKWVLCGCLLISNASAFAVTIDRRDSKGSMAYAATETVSKKKARIRTMSNRPGVPPEAKMRTRAEIDQRSMLEPLITRFSEKHGVDPALVRAMIEVESGFRPGAQSPKGAVGPMQLMPATAARYGARNRFDPAQNIEAGIRYLKDLLDLHGGNVALALAAYNAGEATVARHGQRIPPYRETLLYVPAVLSRVRTNSPLQTP